MNYRKFVIPLLMLLLMSGCVVFSFYPIYTQKDLFPNDYLLGDYMTDDSAFWSFKHVSKKKDGIEIIDSLSYQLLINENDEKTINSEFRIHLIRIEDQLVADFFLEDYSGDNEFDMGMFDLHIIPVHTFAKVNLYGDSIHFQWFDPEWFEELIEKNRVRIHHENNDQTILLTARPRELQKFVKKYLNSKDAFKDGMDMMLYRKEE